MKTIIKKFNTFCRFFSFTIVVLFLVFAPAISLAQSTTATSGLCGPAPHPACALLEQNCRAVPGEPENLPNGFKREVICHPVSQTNPTPPGSIGAVAKCRNGWFFGEATFIKCDDFQRICVGSDREYVVIEASTILPYDDVACLHKPIDPSIFVGKETTDFSYSCTSLVDCYQQVAICRASVGIATYFRGDTEVKCRKITGSPVVNPTLTPPPSPPTPTGAFVPLVGIPGVNPDSDLGTYINALYVLSISLAALLAVIKIIVAGVKWMLTDLISGKEEAKKDIQGALTGLLIVISAVLILTVINPDLAKTDLILTEVVAPPPSPPTPTESEAKDYCGTKTLTSRRQMSCTPCSEMAQRCTIAGGTSRLDTTDLNIIYCTKQFAKSRCIFKRNSAPAGGG